MKKKDSTSKLCKIVYFDEDSVTDYIQIVAGGKLEKTTELLNETADQGSAGTKAKAGIGVGGVLKALIGFEASASADASLETSFNTNRMAKNIVKNTILTDFIDILGDCPNVTEGDNQDHSVIRKFRGFTVSAQKDSFSYIALISPYLSMLKGGTAIPAGDFNIAVEKLDNTIKSAKGYYEFVGSKGDDRIIFRFNIKSFKNNYKVTDLMRMDISIYAIRVGTSSIDRLDMNSELDIDSMSMTKDNPAYQRDTKVGKEKDPNLSKPLPVYDVLLAGVESDG